MIKRLQLWEVSQKGWLWAIYAVLGIALLTVLLRPVQAQRVGVGILAQTGGACGTGVQHCTVLNWTASTTQGVTYQVFRGTISGGEGSTPINTVTITGTSYIDPITITNSPQTFFYTVEAVETTSGITLNSAPSNEVSVTFPGAPAAPTGATGTVH